jgi:hypothetical protein
MNWSMKSLQRFLMTNTRRNSEDATRNRISGRRVYFEKQAMNLTKWMCIAFFLFCVSPMQATQTQSTADWQLVDFDGEFTFRLPQSFTKHETVTTQNSSAEYRDGQTVLVLEWRPTDPASFSERRQTWMIDYEEATSRIRGRRANIRTYWESKTGERVYHAELYIGNWESRQVDLYMSVNSKERGALDTASQIFKSIVFPLPTPEHPNL